MIPGRMAGEARASSPCGPGQGGRVTRAMPADPFIPTAGRHGVLPVAALEADWLSDRVGQAP